jgi:tetratricopeptide (TPR) repeat protein
MFGRETEVYVDRYTRLERIGHGGMGVVYKAWDPVLKRRVALKLLHPRFADPRRIRHEAQALARLSHPNIVQVLDIGQKGDEIYLVMEYVPGDGLGSVLAAGCPMPRLLSILEQVVDGLDAAHEQGLVHHDIKPSNVLVSPGGTARVADFGLSRVLQSTTPGRALGGTPGFAAPEQLAGRPCDERVDVYALTALVFASVFGAPPRLDSTQQVEFPNHRSCSRRMRRFLRRGLATDPAERYVSVRQWWLALSDATRSRVPLVVVTLAGAAAVSATALAFSGRDRDPCETASAFPWGPDERAAVREHFDTLALPYAPDAFSHVDEHMTSLSTSWTDVRREACQARQRAALACSNGQRAAADEVYSWMVELQPNELERVGKVLRSLPEPEACTMAALDDASSTALDEAVARGSALVAAGRYADARDLLLEVDRPENTRAHAHSLAMHAMTLARAYNLGAEVDAAAVEFEKAYLLSLLAGRDGLAAQAASRMAGVCASALDDVDGTQRWIRNATSALERSSSADAITRGKVELGIAHAHYALGELDLALKHIELGQGLLPTDDESRSDLLTVLAGVRFAQGDAAGALAAQEEGLELMRTLYGPAHPRTVMPMNNIAILHFELGNPERGQALFEQALALSEKTLGEAHLSTAALRVSIGAASLGRRPPKETIEHFERGLRDLEAGLGPGHRELNPGLQGLASAYLEAERLDDAERTILKAIDAANQQALLDPRAKAGILATHASILRLQGRHAEALQTASSGIEVLEKTLGSDHPNVAVIKVEVAEIHRARGDEVSARVALREAIGIVRNAFGPEHPEVARLEAKLTP